MYCMHFCGDKEIIHWLNLPLLYYGVNSQGGGGGDLSPSTETPQVKKTTLLEEAYSRSSQGATICHLVSISICFQQIIYCKEKNFLAQTCFFSYLYLYLVPCSLNCIKHYIWAA